MRYGLLTHDGGSNPKIMNDGQPKIVIDQNPKLWHSVITSYGYTR